MNVSVGLTGSPSMVTGNAPRCRHGCCRPDNGMTSPPAPRTPRQPGRHAPVHPQARTPSGRRGEGGPASCTTVIADCHGLDLPRARSWRLPGGHRLDVRHGNTPAQDGMGGPLTHGASAARVITLRRDATPRGGRDRPHPGAQEVARTPAGSASRPSTASVTAVRDADGCARVIRDSGRVGHLHARGSPGHALSDHPGRQARRRVRRRPSGAERGAGRDWLAEPVPRRSCPGRQLAPGRGWTSAPPWARRVPHGPGRTP